MYRSVSSLIIIIIIIFYKIVFFHPHLVIRVSTQIYLRLLRFVINVTLHIV